MFMRLACISSCCCLLVVMNGCATYAPPKSRAPVEQAPGIEVTVPPAAPQAKSSAAWQPLVDKATEATARGDFAQALALLERAHRIEPDSAQIYLAMAETYRAEGDLAQSKATAERGLLYCTAHDICAALRGYLQ